jgi:hypothetical protein
MSELKGSAIRVSFTENNNTYKAYADFSSIVQKLKQLVPTLRKFATVSFLASAFSSAPARIARAGV